MSNTPYITPPRDADQGDYPVVDRWRQRVSELLNQISDGLDVRIQDQTTEIVDLHLAQYLADLTIINNTAIDDTVIRIESLLTPSTIHLVCFKEDDAFYQGIIIGVTPVSGDIYDIELDTPLDYAYTTAGGCSLTNPNLAIDGSTTPVVFKVSPANLTSGVEWDIVRILFSFIGQGLSPAFLQPDDTYFGTQDVLTKGIVVRSVDGITKNIFNAKSNADMKAHMYDVVYTSKNRDSSYGVNSRRTFGGQSKNGVVVRLSADTSDEMQVIVQDDLTAHINIQAIVQGHVTD